MSSSCGGVLSGVQGLAEAKVAVVEEEPPAPDAMGTLNKCKSRLDSTTAKWKTASKHVASSDAHIAELEANLATGGKGGAGCSS